MENNDKKAINDENNNSASNSNSLSNKIQNISNDNFTSDNKLSNDKIENIPNNTDNNPPIASTPKNKKNKNLFIIILIIVIVIICLFFGIPMLSNLVKDKNNVQNNIKNNITNNKDNKDNKDDSSSTDNDITSDNNTNNDIDAAVSTANMNEKLKVKLKTADFDITVLNVEEKFKQEDFWEDGKFINFTKVKVRITNNKTEGLVWLAYFALVDDKDNLINYPDTLAESYGNNDELALEIPAKGTKEGYLYFETDATNFSKLKITNFISGIPDDIYYINLK